MKLNKKIELGINAVNALRNRTTPTRSEDLAVEIGTSRPFLEQIMRNLKISGILYVKRGPGGGYMVNTAMEKITAYHVAAAMGKDFGVLRLDEAPMSKLHKSIVDAFMGVTL